MGALLNVIGLSVGVALYAMLLLMVVRASHAAASHVRVDPLLLATAVLGLVWNLCALPAYGLPKLGVAGPLPVLTSLGTSALGFLPAVVVHSVLRGRRDHGRGGPAGVLLVAAYAVSTVAAFLNLRSLWTGDPLPSPLAMRLLTFTFVGLLLPLAAVTRGQPGARRALWIAALSIFAVSALHLSQVDRDDPSWPVELVGHHASLPLAVAILYQDFPFALADLFLKRALAVLALATTPLVAVGLLRLRAPERSLPFDARGVGLLITLWVATVWLYPKLQDVTDWFVDTVVLRRPDYEYLRADIARTAQRHDDISVMFDEVCARLAPALSARQVCWRELSGDATDLTFRDRPHGAIAAVVEIPVTEWPTYMLEIADLEGGRRLLSDDHAFLDAVALLIGRRIDTIRITRERYERALHEQEIAKLATEAELRALRSQINPHFLFNALTTIGYLIQTAPPRALTTLMRLTSLLRGVLYIDSDAELTTFGREIDLIDSYLDIERARFEQRLRAIIDVPAALRSIQIPPLILQPIVENAVKHGVGQLRDGGDVIITARLDRTSTIAPALVMVVRDTGAGASQSQLRHGREAGVGLKNIERRLACHYGTSAALRVESAPGAGMIVEIRMPAIFRTGVEVSAERTSA